MRDSSRKVEQYFKNQLKETAAFTSEATDQIMRDLFIFNHIKGLAKADLKRPYFLTRKTLRHKIFDYLKVPFLGPLSSFDCLVSYIRLLESTFGAAIEIVQTENSFQISGSLNPDRASHKEAAIYWRNLEFIPEEFGYLYFVSDYLNNFFNTSSIINLNDFFVELPLYTERNLFFAELLNFSIDASEGDYVLSKEALSNQSIPLEKAYMSLNFITKGRFLNFVPLSFKRERSDLSKVFKYEAGIDL